MIFPERLFEDAEKPGTPAYTFWERAAEVAFGLIVAGLMLYFD